MKLTMYTAYVTFSQDENVYHGCFPDIPDVTAYGNSLDELKANLGVALQEYAQEWDVPTLSYDFVGLVDIELWV